MGVSCKIIVTKPPEGVHRSGETVKGILVYAIDEPTEYKDISISFIGKGSFSLTIESGRYSNTYDNTEYYINRTIDVLNKGPDKTVTLPSGSYRFPFEFRLPYDIPTSYSSNCKHVPGHSGKYWIKYSIMAKFVKPSFFSTNEKCEKDVIVQGTVNPIAPDGPIIAGIRKPISKLNPLLLLTNSGKNEVIHLKSTIAKSYLTPGETIQLNYEIHNDTDINIKRIITDLKQRVTLTSDGLIKKIPNTFEKDVICRGESRSIPNNTKTYIKILLPTKPELYSIQHSKIIKVEYFVKITVEVPFPRINASLEIPIAIGERPGHGILDVLELGDDDDFDPPTYKQSVSEVNKMYEV